ncbi:MAG: amidohydrolase [Humibacillus sp.]|nr:amidohydrolase [Humibacillus sp.]MDN5775596.1 amidohydrolase [Humibacillus sp.]
MTANPGARLEGDAAVPVYWRTLGLPGLADIHVHFLPEPMERKVWAYFDAGVEHYGTPWPIRYRNSEGERLDTLRGLGLRAIPALAYAHKPGMAEWLNEWSADFAERIPDAVHCATFYPEPGVDEVVERALSQGARLFKIHVQVGEFAPDDPLLEPAWARLEPAQVPVVIHAGSAPIPGTYTGPRAVGRLLERHPRLKLVIAHMGMPEYHEFADLAEAYVGVHLDTTMAFTDFTSRIAPAPKDYLRRLPGLVDKVVLGSDFPSIPYPYAHQIAALARLELGDDWMRAVLWHNGARLLDISRGYE